MRAPNPRAYAKAMRISRDEPIARVPSVNATAPASRSRPSSAMSSPRQPVVMAAYGRIVRLPVSSPRVRSRRTSAGSSIAGSVSRQRGKRSDAAGGRSLGGGSDSLAVLVARLAEGSAHIEQTGTEDGALLRDDSDAIRTPKAGAEVSDPPVAHQQVTLLVQSRRGVQQAN